MWPFSAVLLFLARPSQCCQPEKRTRHGEECARRNNKKKRWVIRGNERDGGCEWNKTIFNRNAEQSVTFVSTSATREKRV